MFAAGCASAPKAASPSPQQASFRVKPPPVGPAPRLVLPQFESVRLDNGFRVLVGERHEPPLVHIELVFAAGSGSDPEGQAGLAALTYRWLLEGAGPYEAIALDKAFAALGATPAVQVEPDGARIGVTVLSEHSLAALALLAQVALNPRFAPAGFALRKTQQLADLAALESDPVFVAREHFASAAYGRNHPYGHVALGTQASIEGLGAQAGRDFYAKHVGPKATALIMTGDITLTGATALAQRYFGSWVAPAERPPAPPPVQADSASPIQRIDREGLSQTELLVGRPALPAGDEDEAGLQIASAAMGGMFSSRLNLDLREQHGYAYGAHAAFDPRQGPGPWLAYAAVRSNVTAPALAAMLDDLGKLPVRPFSRQEVEAARRGLINAMPGEFESAGDLGRALARIYLLEQPLDRYQRLSSALLSTQASRIDQVAVRIMHPSALTIVTVGDPQVLATQLAKITFDPPRAVSTLETIPLEPSRSIDAR